MASQTWIAIVLVAGAVFGCGSPQKTDDAGQWKRVVVAQVRPATSLAPRERLEAACDMATYLNDDLNKPAQRIPPEVLAEAKSLRDLTCD